MRIAIVGSGISGLSAAHQLSSAHEVTLFEAQSHLGGHTHTHTVEQAGQRYRVDTGFIVCNRHNYTGFFRLLDSLGVNTQSTTMSFAVSDARSGLEYNATDLNRLFIQRRNLLSPRFIRMVRDILRFYRESPGLLETAGPGPSLGDYLGEHRYSPAFIEQHLIPMGSALWSAPPGQMLQFPARYLVQFMANHRMLGVAGRPQWEVVCGGSASYVEALMKVAKFTAHVDTPVASIERATDSCVVRLRNGDAQSFDHVVLACHSDQALSLIAQPTFSEREVLGAMAYQRNDVVLHRDAALLPKRRRAWAAWNALLPVERPEQCTVTYCMNLLQGFESPEPYCVTLNRTDLIDPSKIDRRLDYAHPIYSHASVAAQARWGEISGVDRLHFCGAYWGYGFHEDGVQSALKVCAALGAPWR
jgi:uncharacterized protein